MDNPLSLNRYTYTHNNPLRYWDPTGHKTAEQMLGDLINGLSKAPKDLQSGLNKAAQDLPGALENGANKVFVESIVEDYNELTNGDLTWGDAGAGVSIGLTVATLGGAKRVTSLVKVAKKVCNCFTAGTKVLTDEGEKPIEEIEVGDKVLAKDDETGEMAYKEVEWLFQRDVEETYNITVGGEVITTTDEHPFWIVGKGWVKSQDLLVGDILTTSENKELAIENIEVKKEHATVYNFMVKDFHTYFVSNLGIWTHNACKVNFNGADVDVYRGGNSFTVKPNEIKIDPKTGMVKTTHGVSLDVNASTVSKFGGAYRIDSLPDGLKIIQRGGRAEHFEIVPAYDMPLDQFQKLLNQITVSPVK